MFTHIRRGTGTDRHPVQRSEYCISDLRFTFMREKALMMMMIMMMIILDEVASRTESMLYSRPKKHCYVLYR